MGRRSKQTFLQRRTDGQQTNEKMFNITNHQGNANQNHNEISPHTCHDGYYDRIIFLMFRLNPRIFRQEFWKPDGESYSVKRDKKISMGFSSFCPKHVWVV